MGQTACRFALLLVTALPACAVIGGAEGPSADTSRRRALEYGVLALESGDFETAVERIAPVAAVCPTDAPGRSAMLLLASIELDPRNPEARPDVAAELAAFQFARRAEGEWEGALARELYTLALDHGAEAIDADEVPDVRVLWDRYLSDPEFSATPIGIATTDSSAPATTVELAADADADTQTDRVIDAADGGPRCGVREPVDDLVMPALTREPLASRTAAPAAAPAAEPAAPGNADSRALQAEVERLRAALAAKEQELDRIRRTLRP